ncbi:uncharacterized protein LOC128468001 [Spea bombifrons]|uniref:uncharacterized protein LOC128468001 n=1 Tax=Spea bombifrons TaxID=233779 RepID=UPI00234BEFC2|nr:uncharacterized protein LOC128468001 [Spea bombifrons]
MTLKDLPRMLDNAERNWGFRIDHTRVYVMEKALQQIVGYLFLHLNTMARQSAAVEKVVGVLSISVKAEIFNREMDRVPCTITNFIWPDIWYDAVLHTTHNSFDQEKQNLLLFFFLDYTDVFCSELPEIHGMHQTIMREIDQILFLNQSMVRESVQSVIDEALQDFSKADLNHRTLERAGFVTAEAISNIMSNSTNHVFRKSCSDYLQDCEKHSAIKTIQHMFLKAARNRVLKTKDCDSGKELAEDKQAAQCGKFTINAKSTNSSEKHGCNPGCSNHHLKKRRRVKETSGEESWQVDKGDDDWLKEVYNLSNW